MKQEEQVNDQNKKTSKEYTIIINAREHKISEDQVSFDDVIRMAFGEVSSDPNVAYTVTYKRGQGNKPEGSMVKGDSVKIKEGMIFNATSTNKS
jgi:hypothetical protein